MRKFKTLPVLLALLMAATLAIALGAGCGGSGKKPQITNLDPSSGVAGININIVGANFGNAQGNSVVHVGVKVADVVSWSNVLVVAVVGCAGSPPPPVGPSIEHPKVVTPIVGDAGSTVASEPAPAGPISGRAEMRFVK